MPERFLTHYRAQPSLLQRIRDTDMASVIRPLIQQLRTRDNVLEPDIVNAAISATVNCQAASIILFANQFGNVEARFPHHRPNTDRAYTVPGSVIFFALPGHSFRVTRHRLQGDVVHSGESIRVDAQTPLLVDGKRELFCLDRQKECEGAVLSFNYPDPSKDVAVYCRRTLKKLSWFPIDQNVQRMLVGLESMAAINDPNVLSVAVELSRHPHLEVRRAAFDILDQQGDHNAIPCIQTADNLKPGSSLKHVQEVSV